MSRRFVPPALALLAGAAPGAADDVPVGPRDDAFAEGHACGLREGRLIGLREGEARAAEQYRAELAALRDGFAKHEAEGALAAALDRTCADRAALRAALEVDSRAAIVAAFRAIVPVLMASAVGQEAAEVVAAAIADHADDALQVTAHPDTLAHLAAAVRPGLTLRADAALEPGAVAVAWTGGGLRLDPAALCAQVEAILSPHPDPMQESAA